MDYSIFNVKILSFSTRIYTREGGGVGDSREKERRGVGRNREEGREGKGGGGW